MKDIKVEKRDGSFEYWNYDKLLVSLTKTGINMEQAEKVVSEIEVWVKGKAKGGSIKSIAIREKAIEKLKELDSVSADHYVEYKK